MLKVVQGEPKLVVKTKPAPTAPPTSTKTVAAPATVSEHGQGGGSTSKDTGRKPTAKETQTGYATPTATQPTSTDPTPPQKTVRAVPSGVNTNTGSASAALQGYTTSGPAQQGQAGYRNVPSVERQPIATPTSPPGGGSGGHIEPPGVGPTDGGPSGGERRVPKGPEAHGPGTVLPPQSGNPKAPAKSRALSQQGLGFIESWEKFEPDPYTDSAGNATIGWGHLLHYGPVTDADREKWGSISMSRANALLRQDAATAIHAVHDLVKKPLTQAQFDALVSFTYNVGAGSFASSTLLRDLNAGRFNRVPDDMRMWTVGGPGLKSRRDDEVLMFTKGVYLRHR